MDPLDLALLDAWNRLTPRIRADRLEDSNLESARRASRRSSATLNRPLRAWCLCLRAADSRLDTYAAVAPYAALRINAPHTLYIDAPTVRKLVAPITIPWPGLRLRVAARRLGRDPATIHSWVKRGVLQVTYEAPSIHSHRGGRKIPIVWTPSPLDPNADLARAPDPVWGSMWQHHHTRVPDDLTLIVNREMTYRYDPRRRKKDLGLARGWQFICPGLPLRAPSASSGIPLSPWERVAESARPGEGAPRAPGATGGSSASARPIRVINGQPLWPQHPEDHPPITCGRPARRLYCPLPIIDLPTLLGHDPLSPWERVAESARPGEGASPLDASMPQCLDAFPSFFACSHCHRLRYDDLTDGGWNTFIAYISRGLLYGHEVERPAANAYKRKRRYAPKTRRTPRRDQVLALLLEGLTAKQIAARLGITPGTVSVQAGNIYRAHNVHSRAQLCRELGVPPKRPLTPKLAEARDLLLEGLTYPQAAARLGMPLKTFESRAMRVYKHYGVHSLDELRRKLDMPARDPLTPKLAATRDLLLDQLTLTEVAARLGLSPRGLRKRAKAVYTYYGVHFREELRERVRRPTPSESPKRETTVDTLLVTT